MILNIPYVGRSATVSEHWQGLGVRHDPSTLTGGAPAFT